MCALVTATEHLPAKVDVVVVGAGPAGSVCARKLAENDLDVVLIEREALPRYKTCGGGLVSRALDSLDLPDSMLDEIVERRCERLELNLLDAGLAFAVNRRPAPILMTMRSALDACLADLAVDAGGRLVASCEFHGLDSRGESLRLRTSLGEVETGWIVGADGVGSRVARAAGWTEGVQTVPAIESEIRVGREVFEKFAGAARFDFGFVPHGYGWVFPKREHLSVGCLTTRPESTRLSPSFDRYLQELGLDAPLERVDHGFAIPIRPRSRELTRGRVLLVGDAAGLADPITCEGITHAIWSGQSAARAILEGGRSAEAVAQRYSELVEKNILSELRWSRRLAPLLYDYPSVRGLVFRRLGDRLCRVMADIFAGQRTLGSLVKGPRTYSRLLASLLRSQVAS